jgi:hypothetical protein
VEERKFMGLDPYRAIVGGGLLLLAGQGIESEGGAIVVALSVVTEYVATVEGAG